MDEQVAVQREGAAWLEYRACGEPAHEQDQ